ncbi:MAG: hypothetical protein JWM76_180 [Pseudonocardiales bacterium]|nr:hypothetical protein [Pseudonocardiales bacterium]
MAQQQRSYWSHDTFHCHTQLVMRANLSGLIISGAVAIALWLGFTAPSVSPVAPPPIAAPASIAPVVPGAPQPSRPGS